MILCINLKELQIRELGLLLIILLRTSKECDMSILMKFYSFIELLFKISFFVFLSFQRIVSEVLDAR